MLQRRKNIEPLFKKIKEIINLDESLEIIIVDNGSTDDTKKTFILLTYTKREKLKFMKLKNIGYGHGIMSGVNISKGDFIGWCHADLQTEPLDVYNAFKKHFNLLKNEQVIIKGLRKNRNFFDVFFTFCMSVIASIFFFKLINDINAQPKIFSKNFKKYLNDYPIDFSLDLYLLVIAKMKNFKIINFDVILKPRLYNDAKGGGTFKGKIILIKRTLLYMIRLKKKLWKL